MDGNRGLAIDRALAVEKSMKFVTPKTKNLCHLEWLPTDRASVERVRKKLAIQILLCVLSPFLLCYIVASSSNYFPYPTASQVLSRMGEIYGRCKSYEDTGFASGHYNPEISEPALVAFQTNAVSGMLRFKLKNAGGKQSHRHVPSYDILYNSREAVLKWNNVQERVGKEETLDSVLSGFDGTNGAARPVLGLLFPNEIDAPKLTEIGNPKIISRRAVVGKRKCFKICGDLGGNSVTLWIDKSSYLVRKVETIDEFDPKPDLGSGDADSADKGVFKTTVVYNPILDGGISEEVFDWK